MKVDLLDLNDIVIDRGTQMRVSLSEELIADYAAQMADGAVFPKPVIFFDGLDYILADGFHRYFAHKKNGEPFVECEIRNGTLREAKLHAKQCNLHHGARATIEDRRKSAIEMLQDSEWSTWSNRAIARHCGCSHSLVGDLRKEMENPGQAKAEKKKQAAPAKPPKAVDENPVEDVAPTPQPVEQPSKGEEIDQRDIAIESLTSEVEDLRQQIATGNFDGDEDERITFEKIISDLKEELEEAHGSIAFLQRQLDTAKTSRDTFMNENAELKSQVKYWQRRFEKLEKKAA